MVSFGDIDLQAIATKAGSIFVIVLVMLIFLGIVGVVTYFYMKHRAYKFRVIVWKRFRAESGQEMPIIVSIAERGRVKKDKKLKKWVFHLQRANIDLGEEELASYDEDRELDIPSVPHQAGGEVVFVEKLTSKKYAVGEPFIVEGTVKIRVTQADLAEAMRSYDINARTFGKKDNSLLAFAMYITFAVLILVLVVIILNKLDVLSEFGDKWIEGAQIIKSNSVPSDVPG